MRSSRLALTVTAVALLSALTACSGDSDSDGGSGSGGPSATDSSAADTPKIFTRKCDVEVTVTGSVSADWTGKGTVSNESQITMYQGDHGDDRLIVYAGNDDIPTNANLTIGGATFTTSDPDTGLDVDEKGTKATIDADMTGVDGDGPHVTASFTCGKG